MEVFGVPWRATCSLFFPLPLAVMIGYYVAAGTALHTRDIHTPGGKERLHCREWAFRGSQKKEILHELTYKKAISYKTLFIYSILITVVQFHVFFHISCHSVPRPPRLSVPFCR